MTPSPNTASALQQLSDEELIEKVAVEVMGWKLVRHSDWQNPIWAKENEGGKIQATYNGKPWWNPLTMMEHTAQVLNAMRERSLVLVELHEVRMRDPGLFGYCFGIDSARGHRPPVVDASQQRAICIAALLAVSA